jgi:hypothetical protein
MKAGRSTSPRGLPRNWPGHLHPTFLGIGAGLLCIAFTFFPPGLYSDLIGEKDYMFADPTTILFIGLCTACFCMGCNMMAGSPLLNHRRALAGRAADAQSRRMRAPGAMAILAALIGVGTALEFIGNPALFITALATGSAESLRGDAVSNGVESGFSVLALLPLGFPLLLWAVCAALRSGAEHKSARRLITACAIVYGICLMVTLQRNLLLPYLIALFGLASAIRLHPNGVSRRKLAKGLLMAGAAIVGLFILIAYFRGGASESPLTVLTGYLPASVNRLAALLHGKLTPAIAGEPYYSFRFAWHPPLVRRLVPIDAWGRALGLQIPETVFDGWVDEFDAVASAGLNPSYIWATAMGYVYYDFGWLAPLYFVALGAMAGRFWNLFLQRRPAGIILYPYFATCILLWPTDNLAAHPQIWLFIFVAMALMATQPARRSTARRQVNVRAEQRS